MDTESILYTLFWIYVYLSVIVLLGVRYSQSNLDSPFWKRLHDRQEQVPRFVFGGVILGAFMGIMLFFEAGFEKALFFIPDDAITGTNTETGDPTYGDELKTGISVFGGIGMAAWLFWVLFRSSDNE